MSIAEPRIKDPEAVKAEWLERLNALVSLIKGWVEASGWRTRQTAKTVTEPALGRYEVPLLIMERGEIEVILAPLTRVRPEADGTVDLYLMPGYDDLATIESADGGWIIRDTFPLDRTVPPPVFGGERLPPGEDAINRVLDAINPDAYPL
jgi:hypothetical protein